MFIFPVLVVQNHLKSLSNKLDIGLNSLHRISPTTIKPIRTNAEPFIVNPSQIRHSGEHIVAIVISIISDARNVLMPIFQLFYGIVVQWPQTVTGYLESHNVASVLVASHFSGEEEHVGAIAVLIVKAHYLLHFMVAVIIIRMSKSKQRSMLLVQLAVSRLKLHHTVDIGCGSAFACVMPDSCHETVVRDYCMVNLGRVRLTIALIETCIGRLVQT